MYYYYTAGCFTTQQLVIALSLSLSLFLCNDAILSLTCSVVCIRRKTFYGNELGIIIIIIRVDNREMLSRDKGGERVVYSWRDASVVVVVVICGKRKKMI
ncbi:hypothetical protein BDB00DRAFT_632546 [Zychaea mexicana]|uniref:uncharacterized protein n=1 Tax=Zychaea mexicana TaxID=64656 RepID=UPI0022FE06FE|nr:uncharacterized protein BDB00DRAFT_632546 [Zychaea mexicana]KAI9489218.1 hypothetical protein BDB00DRAFT_632546 [Zychaea mexicana]